MPRLNELLQHWVRPEEMGKASYQGMFAHPEAKTEPDELKSSYSHQCAR